MIPAAERSPTIKVLEVPSEMALRLERRTLAPAELVLVDRTLLRCLFSLAIARSDPITATEIANAIMLAAVEMFLIVFMI